MSEYTLNYPLFDGKSVIENVSVSIKDGKISRVSETDIVDNRYFLMPGLIDAHTHIGTAEQIRAMLKNGVTAAGDVSASASLVEASKQLTIVSSAGMTMGTLNGKAYVKKAMENGAKYIKVLLMEPNLMLKSALNDICYTAHENGLKVAVHATSVKSVRMAVDCGADILLHVPMKENIQPILQRRSQKKALLSPPRLL